MIEQQLGIVEQNKKDCSDKQNSSYQSLQGALFNVNKDLSEAQLRLSYTKQTVQQEDSLIQSLEKQLKEARARKKAAEK